MDEWIISWLASSVLAVRCVVLGHRRPSSTREFPATNWTTRTSHGDASMNLYSAAPCHDSDKCLQACNPTEQGACPPARNDGCCRHRHGVPPALAFFSSDDLVPAPARMPASPTTVTRTP